MEPFAPWHRFYTEENLKLEYPRVTLWEAVYKSGCKHPLNTALVYLKKKITYKEMLRRIDEVKCGFEKLGVKKGDMVTISLPNTPQAVYALYALNRMGAVACFVHPLLALAELEQCMKITNSQIVILLSNFKDVLKKSTFLQNKTVVLTSPYDELEPISSFVYGSKNKFGKSRVWLWRTLMRGDKHRETLPERFSAYEPAVVFFSGGTTGKPKGVLISSYALNAMSTATSVVSGCSIEGKAMLAVMPVFHGFGLGVCIHTALICGGCAILVPRFSAEGSSKIIKKYRPSFIAGVPAMFDALTKSKNLKNADLSFLAGVFSGGDTLQKELKSKLDGYLKEHGAKVTVREGYGLTECVAVSCLTPCGKEKNGSVGIPLPDTYYKICKVGTTQNLPLGEVGEICISGPTLMLSYLNDDEETKKIMKLHSDGRVWLHTGDMGMMDEDGFVYFKGRIKRMIVTNGYNVYPLQVEQVLCSHPAVKLCCVVGIKDPCKAERVKAFVVNCDNKNKEKLKAELFSLCKEQLSAFAVPREIEFVSSLPKTKVGKIDYKTLELKGIGT